MACRLAALALLLAGLLGWSSSALAVLDVQPRDQLVNASRSSSFYARWLSDAGRFRVDPNSARFCAFYDGLAAGCRGGSDLGRLPAMFDEAPTGFVDSFDERVTVPRSIMEKALRLAKDNPVNALIFFVRRLIPEGITDLGLGPGVPVIVQINLRLTGSSSTKALAFTKVKIFGREPDREEVRFVRVTDENRETGEICVEIEYTGNGRISGWWEVWTRNDPELREIDRRTEASLTEAQRREQRRFRQVKRIRVYLNPSGRTVLKLPYSAIPDDVPGVVLVFIHIETSRDDRSRVLLAPNARSTTPRLVEGGAIASFPMPVLPVRIGLPEDEDELVSIDARFTRFESAAGTPGRYGVVWTALRDKVLVVEITLRNTRTGAVHRVIAPVNAGRAVFPDDVIPGDAMGGEASNGRGLPAGYELTVAILGLDRRTYPGSAPITLGGQDRPLR